MTTLANLQTFVSRDLRDTANAHWTLEQVTDLINAGIAEVSKLCPRTFQADIEPDGSQTYAVLTGDPRIRLQRVEIWSVAPSTVQVLMRIPPHSESLSNETDAGWRMWNGTLELPTGYATYLADATKNLRVWGWAPFVRLVDSGDTTDLTEDAEWGVREYAVYKGYDRLASDRALFVNWQTAANNTDISYAQLLGSLSEHRSAWQRRRRELQVVREL